MTAWRLCIYCSFWQSSISENENVQYKMFRFFKEFCPKAHSIFWGCIDNSSKCILCYCLHDNIVLKRSTRVVFPKHSEKWNLFGILTIQITENNRRDTCTLNQTLHSHRYFIFCHQPHAAGAKVTCDIYPGNTCRDLLVYWFPALVFNFIEYCPVHIRVTSIDTVQTDSILHFFLLSEILRWRQTIQLKPMWFLCNVRYVKCKVHFIIRNTEYSNLMKQQMQN